VEASGDWACFTRPELTSERVSYPIMTPPAAVGLLSSVFWKPQFRWVVERIEVLAPVTWSTFRRNESGSAITRDHLAQGYLDVNDTVQQRMTTMLRDVHYRIHANVWVHPEADEQDPAKWRAQFQRRVERGQSFRTPFLGMREFHADVTEASDTRPHDWTEDLGVMHHSITYDERTRAETYDWFDAKVVGGVMEIPRRGLMAEHNERAR
jgi:CRISPR-associated protein Cas5d